MRVVMFYHSLRSDWNHGNAHFLRGVATELLARGHEVSVYEPESAWSVENLIAERGRDAVDGYRRVYPTLASTTYTLDTLDLDAALDDADLVLVHEWNDHELVRRVGEHRRRVGGYHVLFHDTHHRAVTEPASMAAYDLRFYDGVLAFGSAIRDIYQARRWTENAWVWHEAADVRVFYPRSEKTTEDLVWIGNWGDGERTAELREFLIQPVKDLRLTARVHGVRYPNEARALLAEAGIEYRGWLPNYDAPVAFARARLTVHVPRRPYVRALPGIPTIRVFEALACGIPLVSAPWDDVENLFTTGADYLVARDGGEMRAHLRELLHDPARARSLAAHGRRTILTRHTCGHRVDELLAIARVLGVRRPEPTTNQLTTLAS